jgi:hypothetical protein
MRFEPSLFPSWISSFARPNAALGYQALRQDRVPAARFCAARISRQEAEITDSGPGPSGLANTNGNAGVPSDLASIDATQLP